MCPHSVSCSNMPGIDMDDRAEFSTKLYSGNRQLSRKINQLYLGSGADMQRNKALHASRPMVCVSLGVVCRGNGSGPAGPFTACRTLTFHFLKRFVFYF